MRKFSFAVLTGLALVGGADQSAIAATKTFYVGTCKPGKADFTTIQEGASRRAKQRRCRRHRRLDSRDRSATSAFATINRGRAANES